MRPALGAWEQAKLEVRKRDGRVCYLCGRTCVVFKGYGGAQPDTALTIDHVVPLILGGTNDPSNLRVCCYGCNQLKGGGLPLVFGPGANEKQRARTRRLCWLTVDRWHFAIPSGPVWL